MESRYQGQFDENRLDISIEQVNQEQAGITSEATQTTSKVGHGYAHSKIILMGEHAVVYDYPAIALPFPAVQVHVQVEASQHSNSYIDCQYYAGPLEDAPSMLANLKRAISLTLDSFKILSQPIQITIDSTIPQERGMGSSAAVSVAIVRAICDYYCVPISDKQLHLIVNQAEVIAHESTSGLDTLMTSTPNPVIYRKSQTPRPFPLKMDAFLVVADSGQAGQTKLAVNHVRLLKEKKPLLVEELMSAIGKFVQQAHDAIQANDATELGRLMTYNHYYLNQLGISNPILDRIINAAWLGGALGAKLTGGGLGGCVIALATDEASAQVVAQEMKEAGAIQSWYIPLD
ncbi:mevalonate kinase [Fundicoccus sp. Sow4_D5]|uniref:mevalonate kinase n=1 Tax=Fundicoccus sp. Sow4_D5 TaxID=3438782 RepID=UPI003F92F82F